MVRRILLVSNFFPPRTIGGAEIVAFRQARELTARGHEVTILAGDQPSDTAPSGTLNFDVYEGLPVYRLSIRSLDPDLNFFWPAAARRLTAVMATHRIDVVHFHNVMGLGANLIPVAKAAGAQCLVTLHDHWGFCLRATRLRPDDALCNNFEECSGCLCAIQPAGGVALPTRLRRDYVTWCLHHADRLITPSAYLASAYEQAGFSARQIIVISNGIDLDTVPAGPKEPSPNGAMRFLCSAYLGEHKGMLVLLEALKLLLENPNIPLGWHVTIAGEGHLRSKMEQILRASRLNDHVTLAGRLPRHELLDLLSKTDVTVLASVWPENEPVSMLEAVASGTAQIATRLGGNVELVEDQVSGLLVAPGNPAELAAAMCKYILNPALAAQHGARNRERRSRFDEATTVQGIEAVLNAYQRSGPAIAPPREPVIVCGTGWPSLEVCSLVNHVHKHLYPGPSPRFIWREWADASVWRDATLLWLWDRHPEEWLVNTALRRGVPILAPATGWAEGLARHYGAIILYNTYLEALAAMRVLLSMPTLRNEFARRSRAASTAAAALAPRAAFNLTSDAVC